MKKSSGRIMALLSAIICVFCFGVFSKSKPDPYAKMPSLVKLTTGFSLANDPKLPPGKSLEKTDVLQWIEKNLNIKVSYIWTTSDQNNAYENKINLLIASNDIPDVLSIDVEPMGFNILRKLINNDLIMDLTKTYQSYVSPTLREYHEKAGNIALREVTFDGKLMAIPALSDIETALPVIWVRQDWLEELKLPEPETLDDVAHILGNFMAKKKSTPLPGCDEIFRGDTTTFDFLFGAYNAYPGDWIRDANGSVVYGSTQPETREALAKLQEWYKEGIIDPEFAIKDPDRAVMPVMRNQCGLFQGAWWSVWWPIQDSKKNDDGVKWKAYFIKGVDGKYHGRSYPPVRNFVVVKKGYRYPEAVMKIINWHEEAALKKLDWYNQLIGPGGKYNKTAVSLWPFSAAAKYPDEISRRYRAIMDVIEGRTPMEKADPESQFHAQAILKERKEPTKDIGTWCIANQWEGASVFIRHKIEQKIPAFSGTTTLMIQKKSVLEDLEKKTFFNLIMGKKPMSEFDEFVKTWNSLGGEEIADEINRIIKK